MDRVNPNPVCCWEPAGVEASGLGPRRGWWQGGGTHLAEHLGLAHEDENVGSQDGDAEVEQDDGALRLDESAAGVAWGQGARLSLSLLLLLSHVPALVSHPYPLSHSCPCACPVSLSLVSRPYPLSHSCPTSLSLVPVPWDGCCPGAETSFPARFSIPINPIDAEPSPLPCPPLSPPPHTASPPPGVPQVPVCPRVTSRRRRRSPAESAGPCRRQRSRSSVAPTASPRGPWPGGDTGGDWFSPPPSLLPPCPL